MNMLAKVKSGVQPRAQRVVLYGVESVGKTTLAAQAPAPVFLDVEDGTAHLDVPRLPIKSWSEMEAAVKELAVGGHSYRTVVIDSVDWAEKLAVEDMLARDKKTGIEDYGYGRGYVAIAEKMTRWLALLDTVLVRGVHVLLIAHAKVARHEPPDGMQAYDRYELKLTKQTSPLVKEWADALLFANFKTKVVETESGRAKAIGGRERVLKTQRAAAYDAKCRVPGVPEEIPMTWEAVAPVFGLVDRVATPASTQSAPPAQPALQSQSEKPGRKPQDAVFFDVLHGSTEEAGAAVLALRAWGWLAADAELSALSDRHCKQILSRPDAFRKRIREFHQK